MRYPVEIHPVSFNSRFGGLWTDLNNAEEAIDGRLALGRITTEQAELLRCWVKNGYIVLSHAVQEQLIEAAKIAIDQIYLQGKAYVEAYDTGVVHVTKVEPRHRDIPHKLIDTYALSSRVRTVLMSDGIVDFLNLIFDSPAMVFQSIYFQRGSQQDIHQDTAYVRVNRPMEMVGVWIAMEDIKPGSGELEYFVGSHKVPDFIWKGESKWMPHGDMSDHPHFLKHVIVESERLGLKRERFLPKKGDALIWNADLCHGGSPITSMATRKSLVSHWCPVTAHPYYLGTQPSSDKIKASGKAHYCYAYHGASENPYL